MSLTRIARCSRWEADKSDRLELRPAAGSSPVTASIGGTTVCGSLAHGSQHRDTTQSNVTSYSAMTGRARGLALLPLTLRVHLHARRNVAGNGSLRSSCAVATSCWRPYRVARSYRPFIAGGTPASAPYF